MTKKIIAAIFLTALILILLNSCGKKRPEGKPDTLQIYYSYKEQYSYKGELIGNIDIPVSADSDLIYIAITKITEDPPSETMVSAFPDNVKILSYTQKGGTISVSLSQSYRTLDPVKKSIANACLVLTLCQLSEVDSVSIYVEDALIENELSAEDIIQPNYEVTEYEKQLTLYYSDDSNSFLEEENHLLTIGQDRQLVEYIIDELVRGPKNDNLRETLPKGTEVLSIEVKKNLCIVNLSDEFLLNKPMTAAGERVAVYSIVNSITEITGIEAVQIIADGEKIDKYYIMSLKEPLTRSDDIIWGKNPDMGEAVFNAYMSVNRDMLVMLPVIVKMNYALSQEQNAAEAMLSLKSKYGYSALIPAGTKLNSIYTEDRVCYLDLSPEFRVEGDTLNMELAMKALAASIIDTGNADYVTIYIDGKIVGEKIEKDESIIIY